MKKFAMKPELLRDFEKNRTLCTNKFSVFSYESYRTTLYRNSKFNIFFELIIQNPNCMRFFKMCYGAGPVLLLMILFLMKREGVNAFKQKQDSGADEYHDV